MPAEGPRAADAAAHARDRAEPAAHGSDPAEPAGESSGHEFACGNCGAPMVWDPDADALACDHCGERTELVHTEATILERSLEDAGSAARGLGVDLRVARCGSCGASITFETGSTAESCAYCGSSSVLAREANRNAIRPESLVPLDVGRAGVEKAFRRWLKRLWFRPNALRRAKHFDAVGIYVPFWSFDCDVRSTWSAQAGRTHVTQRSYTSFVKGRAVVRSRPVTRVHWFPASGRRRDVHDDLLVPASGGLPPKLLDELGRFDTEALVPYRPGYLAGWRAEEYALDLEAGWEAARERIGEEQRRRCASDVPGDTHRDLRVANEVSDVRWKHVLLPIWSLQYRFRGEVYTVLVHGQTGRVVGRAPYSPVKVALGVLALAAIVVGLVLVSG